LNIYKFSVLLSSISEKFFSNQQKHSVNHTVLCCIVYGSPFADDSFCMDSPSGA